MSIINIQVNTLILARFCAYVNDFYAVGVWYCLYDSSSLGLDVCRYIPVVARLECPNITCKLCIAIPCCARSVAKLCRNVWGVMGFVKPARTLVCLKIASTPDFLSLVQPTL